MEICFNFIHIGNKSIQEDLFIYFKTENSEFYFVFDCHGYKSKKDSFIYLLTKNNFFKTYILNFFNSISISIKEIKKCFKELDIKICNKIETAGSCVTGLIFCKKQNKIFLLNLGDTIYHIFDKKKKIINSSIIHDINNQKEIDRIYQCKKENMIKNGRYKKLSMTRSLGDNDCKDIINEPLISIPDVIEIKNNNSFYFLLSTDGIKMNYNIQDIINICEDKNILKTKCLEIMNNNLLLEKPIDNICFIILKSALPLVLKKEKKNYFSWLMYKNLIFIKNLKNVELNSV